MESRKKRPKPLDWMIIAIFVSLVVVTPVWTINNAKKERAQREHQLDSLYGDIYFSGKVVGFHKIKLKNVGMPESAIMCVKVDSSNVDSFYQFDKYTAFKISDGIATFPIGGFDNQTDDTLYEKVVYVSINALNSHKMLFINSEDDTIEKELSYTSGYLKEADMSICDSCQ